MRHLKTILAAISLAVTTNISAHTGAPHSLSADIDLGHVTLTWKDPAAPMTLQWHDGNARGTDNGTCNDKRHAVTLWASSLWQANDLTGWTGNSVTAVTYCLAQDAVDALVAVYEGNTMVHQIAAPASAGEHTVDLPSALKIAPNTNYRFGIRIKTGQNADATAVHDGKADAHGKGNLLSQDGWTWSADGNGDFLITARLLNPADESPESYRILRDGIPVATTTQTSYTLDNEATGTHTYSVEAIYPGQASTAATISATITGTADALPDPVVASATVSDFDVTLKWTADGPCDIARNGSIVASAVTDGQYTDKVVSPDKYLYTITAVQGARRSRPVSIPVTVNLPQKYTAPFITDVFYEPEYGNVTFMWSGDKPLCTGNEPAGNVALDSETDMIWGNEYSTAQLAQYKGKQIKLLRYIVGGVAVGRLSVGIFRKNGEALWQIDMPAHEVELNEYYSIELNNPVTITGDEPLIIGYKAKVAAGVPAIVTDAGPARQGGAVITTDGGATWTTLADLKAGYTGGNICIGAFVADSPAAGPDPDFPAPVSYNVYLNGTRRYSLNATHYNDVPNGFGDFTYTVTAVYDGGIESPHSNPAFIRATIAQKAIAPYALDGVYSQDGTLSLSWKSPESALTIGTADDGTDISAYGEAAGGTLYAINRYSADEMAALDGYKIDHIRFAIADPVDNCTIIVTVGDNIVYRQDVPHPAVSSDGKAVYNDVRLNLPVAITSTQPVGIGYAVSYPAGARPLALDNNGNNALVSTTARHGSFAATVNGRLCVSAVLAAPDAHQQAKAPHRTGTTTYNIYHEGEIFAGDITSTSFVINDAKCGIYCVTAVRNGIETGYSNIFRLWDPNDPEFPGHSSIDQIAADPDGSPFQLYDLAGRLVTQPAPGIYIRRQAGKVGTVIIK